jgi:succinate dehydrogenase / fumarate reductase membrane anchor subunit
MWMLQRISAVYLGGFLLYALLHVWLHPHTDYAGWRAWITQPPVTIAWAGCVLALLVHAWVGLRDVVLDYLHHLGLRVAALTLIAFLLLGCGFWALRILIVAGVSA